VLEGEEEDEVWKLVQRWLVTPALKAKTAEASKASEESPSSFKKRRYIISKRKQLL